MITGRNQPCPCGSGRKYKQCCQKEDLARQSVPAPAGVLPFRRGAAGLPSAVREAASGEQDWAADAVPLMVEFETDPRARPVLVLVTAGELIVHHDLRRRLGGGATAVAEALDRAVAAAGSAVGVLPERLLVRHEEVAAALRPMLADRDIAVSVEESPGLVEAARNALDHMSGYDWWPPACRTAEWAAWGLPLPLVAEVFEAAAAFHRAAPWLELANLQAPRATLPSGREWTCCVLGNAGQEFGLALYSHAEDLFAKTVDAPPGQPFHHVRGRILSVGLEREGDLPSEAIREARRHRWGVAGPDAWPSLLTVNTPGGGASEADVRDLLLLLRAIPSFVDAHGAAMVREERTDVPARAIDWVDPATGVRFRYDGEALTFAEWEEDGSPLDLGLHLDGAVDLDFRNELARIIQDVTEQLGDEADEAELSRAVQLRIELAARDHNDRPQADLGGLSPAQVRRLLESDWDDPAGAVRLPTSLTPAQLAGAPVLANARAFLGLALQRGSLGATQKGNLKLDVVSALMDVWQGDDQLIRLIRRDAKRVREEEVGPIHELRVVCGLAGLVRKRRGAFHLTRRGQELAEPEHAGRLYAHLFRTWFRKFNLGYRGYFDWPELQTQAAFTLHRLPHAARDWRPAADLLPEIVLPYAIDRAPRSPGLSDDRGAFILAARLLDPLVGFGLLERDPPDGWITASEPRYRATVLAERFPEFHG
jgi:hypothetical protein